MTRPDVWPNASPEEFDQGAAVTDHVHWPWLHGPADRPDPRVGDMSASAANRHRSGSENVIWDMWLNQPMNPLREETEAA